MLLLKVPHWKEFSVVKDIFLLLILYLKLRAKKKKSLFAFLFAKKYKQKLIAHKHSLT